MVGRGSSRGEHGGGRGRRGGHSSRSRGGSRGGRGGRGRHRRRIFRGGMHGSQAGAYTGYNREGAGTESSYYYPRGIGGAGHDLEDAFEGFTFPHKPGEKDDDLINNIELLTNESDG